MSKQKWKEYERAEQDYERTRKRLAADGDLSKEDKATLQRIKTKLDALLNELTADGEVVGIVESSTPSRPSEMDGDIQYQGIPLEKISDTRQKNIARANAQSVRQAINSIDAWAARLKSANSDYAGKRHKFDAVHKRTDRINATFAKERDKGAFKKLSQVSGGRDLTKTLAEYDQADVDVETSLSELKEQAYRIAAAQAVVAQAEMALETYDKEKQRGAETEKLNKLKEKLESLKKDTTYVVDKVIDFAKDPKKTLKDIGGDIIGKIKEQAIEEIVDGLLGGQGIKREMAQITQRIDVLNKRLDDLKLGGLKAELNAALNNLKADEQKTNTALTRLKGAQTAQGNTVGILAEIERSHPGNTTVFGQIETYYKDVQDAGNTAMAASKEYGNALAGTRSAIAYTKEIRRIVTEDGAVMRRLYSNWADPDVLQQDEHAKAIIDYTNRMDAWYKTQKVDAELKGLQDFQSYLRKNEQFEYIGKLVDEVQKQGLKLPQDTAKIPK